MKKLLISTALLSTVAVASFATTADAADPQLETDTSVSFKGEKHEPTDKGIGNLVLAQAPTEFIFKDLKVNGSGGMTALEDKKNEGLQTKSHYLVINDDRSATNTGNAPTPWKLKMGFNALKSSDSKATSTNRENLKSKLSLDVLNLHEYLAGAIINENSEDRDYEFPDASNPGTAGKGRQGVYDVSDSAAGVKLGSGVTTLGNAIVLQGNMSGTTVGATEILVKNSAGVDTFHQTSSNMGEQKGGQGYALEFNNPLLTVEQSTLGLEQAKYSSELIYMLDLT